MPLAEYAESTSSARLALIGYLHDLTSVNLRHAIPVHIVGPNQRQMRFLAFGGVSVPRHC